MGHVEIGARAMEKKSHNSAGAKAKKTHKKTSLSLVTSVKIPALIMEKTIFCYGCGKKLLQFP